MRSRSAAASTAVPPEVQAWKALAFRDAAKIPEAQEWAAEQSSTRGACRRLEHAGKLEAPPRVTRAQQIRSS
jgi:hypothetical protein